MTDTNNIVSNLIAQHRGLQADLGGVAEVIQAEQPSSEKIHGLLQKFTTDLTAHLALENDVFYVQLLEQMKAKHQDTSKTEQFIAEMDTIGIAVKAFLGKYSTAPAIEVAISKFKAEFSDIVNTLNLRIESEESGVYAYWGLF